MPYEFWKNSSCFRLDRKKYRKHFNCIIIICPALQWNKTYRTKDCTRHDYNVWLMKRQAVLMNRDIFTIVSTFRIFTIFFHTDIFTIIHDIIGDEKIDNRRQSLLELAISSWRSNHCLWLLTQSYSDIT